MAGKYPGYRIKDGYPFRATLEYTTGTGYGSKETKTDTFIRIDDFYYLLDGTTRIARSHVKDISDVQPFLVIDPDKHDDLAPVWDALIDSQPSEMTTADEGIDWVKTAVKQVINQSATPEEPANVGAVVLDANDNPWVRRWADGTKSASSPAWLQLGNGARAGNMQDYSDIEVTEILYTGKEPDVTLAF